MPQIYNMPNLTDSQNLFTFTRYINIEAEGLLFVIFLLVIWIVTFIGTKQYSSSKAFAYASFVCAILSIPLAILSLIAPKFMYLLIILTAVGFVWVKLADVGPTF